MKKVLTLIAVFIVACPLYADECTTWGCVSTLENIYTNASGHIYVSTPLDETQANCTVYPGNYFVLRAEAQNADKIYASLLVAYMSNTKIQLRVIEGSPICELAYVRLSKKF